MVFWPDAFTKKYFRDLCKCGCAYHVIFDHRA